MRPKFLARVMFSALVVGVIAVGLSFFHQSKTAADHSAHAALTAEICERLADTPDGRYPASLSLLRLSYPDGGSTGLLARFAYRTTGTSCTVRTILRGEDFVRSFP
jgi:hypothetical protein